MNIIKTILVIAIFHLPQVMAQDASRDFLGEINDSDHPDGYREYVELGCWQCHGFQGQGGRAAKLVDPLMPYDVFAMQVRKPRNIMPVYSPNVLSDARLKKIYSYLQNIPESPDPDDIPLLSGD